MTDMLVRVAARWTLPRDVIATMELFGRAEFDAAGLADRRVNVWTDLVGPLLPHARQRPAEFLRQLADAVVPAGGWAGTWLPTAPTAWQRPPHHDGA